MTRPYARVSLIRPSPRIFIPTIPLPAMCISSSTEATSSGFAIIHDQPLGIDPRQVDLDERVLGAMRAVGPCRGNSCHGHE